MILWLMVLVGIPPQAPVLPQAPAITLAKATIVAFKETRQQAYGDACRECERTGFSVYHSDGLEGSEFAAGDYELWLVDGKIMYRQPQIPIPKPDQGQLGEMRVRFGESVNDCPT